MIISDTATQEGLFCMGYSVLSKCKISGLSFYIPNNLVIDIDDYLEYFDNNPKKLSRQKKIMGYGKRYVTSSDGSVTIIDIAEKAARDLIENMNIDINSIDCIIYTSQCFDFLIPTSANVLHGRLGLPKSCNAVDVIQGCTGYVYGLFTACTYISSGACKKILFISGNNVMAKKSNNRGRNFIFSSGVCATLVEYDENAKDIHFLMGSDGTGYENIIAPAGGQKLPVSEEILKQKIYDKDNQEWQLGSLFMDGLSVFHFTLDVVPVHINELLKLSNMSYDDIDFVAIHQANKQIVESVAEAAGIPEGKYSSNTFCEYGNMSEVSCISNFIHNYGDKLADNNYKTTLVSYGIGLSWASVIIDIGNIYCSGLKIHHFPETSNKTDYMNYWINKLENYSAGT